MTVINRRAVLSGLLAPICMRSSITSVKAQDTSGFLEAVVNPFGDPWARRSRKNKTVSVATSSLLRLTGGERWQGAAFEPSAAFWNFHRHASSPYHFDESIAKLADDMPLFRAVQTAFRRAGIQKTFIGYTAPNFVESAGMPGVAEADESFFLHESGATVTPATRLHFADSGALSAAGAIIDIGNPAAREHFAKHIVAAMVKNDLEAVLLDYAGAQSPFGAGMRKRMPQGWFEAFDRAQYDYLSLISEYAAQHGRHILYNGLTADGIWHTDVARAAYWLKACHGSFWEQPFRTEWRDGRKRGDDYYHRLDQFFGLAEEQGKPIIIKQGTYRFHGTEEVNPGWRWRFARTDAQKERRLAEYLFAFHVMFARGPLTPLIYTHPVEAFDIFASEAYFNIWDTDIGAPRGPREKLADHVFRRRFENATVVLNNSDAHHTVSGQTLLPMTALVFTA